MNIGLATRSLIWGAWLMLAALSPVSAQGTFDMPAGAHFNPQKLARIGEFFRDQIASGKIPGAVLLIEQHGKPVYHELFGVQDVVSKKPMTDDTIFRLFSMTKPITSVAAMMLIDEGKLKLDDPVAKYLPSFARTRVGVEKKADDGKKVLDLVPLNRPITIQDLMTQTSGITYGFYGDSMVRKAYANAKIYDGDFDNAEFAERIAALPLAEQPGTRDPVSDPWTIALWTATAELLLCRYHYREEGAFDRGGRWRRRHIRHCLVGSPANHARAAAMADHFCGVMHKAMKAYARSRPSSLYVRRSFASAFADRLVTRLKAALAEARRDPDDGPSYTLEFAAIDAFMRDAGIDRPKSAGQHHPLTRDRDAVRNGKAAAENLARPSYRYSERTSQADAADQLALPF